MDISRVTSPPSILVHDFNGNHGRPARSSREQGGMGIPNARIDDVPPPLPPPRYINDFAAGGDPGWQWGNTPSRSGGFGKSGGSVSPGSSLHGNWDQRMGDDGCSDRPEYARHRSSNMTVRSRPGSDRRHDFSSRFVDEGYHSLSGSSIANQSVYASSFGLSTYACDSSGRKSRRFLVGRSSDFALLYSFCDVCMCASLSLMATNDMGYLKITRRKTFRASKPRKFVASI